MLPAAATLQSECCVSLQIVPEPLARARRGVPLPWEVVRAGSLMRAKPATETGSFEDRLAEAEARDADLLWERSRSSETTPVGKRASVSFSKKDVDAKHGSGRLSSGGSSVSGSPASSRSSKSSRSGSPKRKGKSSWSRVKSSKSWANITNHPEPVAASYDTQPPEPGDARWNMRVANLAKRFPGVETATIQTALTLTNGHAGEAGGEIIRLTGQQPIML